MDSHHSTPRTSCANLVQSILVINVVRISVENMSKISKLHNDSDATLSPEEHCQEHGSLREGTDNGTSSESRDGLGAGFTDDDFSDERNWIDRVRSNPADFWYFYDPWIQPSSATVKLILLSSPDRSIPHLA